MKSNVRFFYCRISTKKQSLKKQVEMAQDYSKRNPDSRRIDRIITEQYSGAKERPKFDNMIKQLRPGDQVIVIRLDRFSRSLRIALNAIHAIRLRQCTMKVLTPFPMYVIKRKNGRYVAVNEARVDMLLLFAQWERKAIYHRTKLGFEIAKAHKKGLTAGRKSRLNSRWASRYREIYDYSKSHSATVTAKHFHNVQRGKYYGKHISRSEVFSIKRMFRNKNNKKPIKMSNKLQRKLELQRKLQTENDDLIMNSRDLSLLKLKNPPLYERKRKQQSKARKNIRTAIKRTKSALNKLRK